MAERIVSPGVFTNENDQSFIQQGIEQIGASIVGPTVKGPAFVPTVVTSFAEFEVMFGGTSSKTYVPFSVRDYLQNAGSVLVTRVLAGGGYSFPRTSRNLVSIISGSEIVSVFQPSKNTDDESVELSASQFNAGGGIQDSHIISFSGSAFSEYAVTASFNPSNQDYITRVVGTSPDNSDGTEDKVFTYLNFKDKQSEAVTATPTGSWEIVVSDEDIIFTSSKAEGYDNAATPWITSQILDGSGTTSNLFKFHHLADGDDTNTDVYVSIAGLKEPADIDGVEQYSLFDVLVRKYGDNDKKPSFIEQYTGVNLDPDSPNFISRRIGDRYSEYDTTLDKVITNGSYNNASKYLRVEVDQKVTDKAYSPKLSPKGFRALNQTMTGFTGLDLTAPTLKTIQHIDKVGVNENVYNSRAYLGWDFLSKDNDNYLKPVPQNASAAIAKTYDVHGNSVSLTDFNVDKLFGHPSSSLWVGSLSASLDSTGTNGPAPSQLQFSVPMQGGFDGISPQRIIKTGANLDAANSFGFDVSTSSAVGTLAYKKAFNILSNDDVFDFNLLTTPGILQTKAPEITNSAISMVEGRGDAVYVFDLNSLNASTATAVNNIQSSGVDSSYATTYYPWVRVLDSSINKPVYVPPSVIIPGVYAQNDSIAADWFAPAGLTRGGLGNVLETKNPLTKSERDQLYEENVNPIGTFPGNGVVIYGQKTLQQQPSALDRLNVRRMLNSVKKFVASSSRYLLFENNTAVTRNRFLNIVTPYLESIQQRQGLYSFSVVMDETNNTSDVIDRNQLVGQIYLQPAKSVEFIILDFNVLPTGATFGA
jgi:hypothetical protein